MHQEHSNLLIRLLRRLADIVSLSLCGWVLHTIIIYDKIITNIFPLAYKNRLADIKYGATY